MVMSGRSRGSLVGSTWVANSVVSLLMISVVANTSRLLQGRDQLARLGKRRDQAAADVDQRADVSGRDLVGQHRARPFVDERLGLRAAARAGAERSLDWCDRQEIAESFELVSESGMEPRAAGPVHRSGEDHQHPGQPLGDIGSFGRHRDAGAGLDRDAVGGRVPPRPAASARAAGTSANDAVCSRVNGSTAAVSSSIP